MLEGYRSKNGTYNGVRLFADVTGLSREEIAWTARRLHHLLNVEKKSKDEAKRIVAAEGKTRPWENGNG